MFGVKLRNRFGRDRHVLTTRKQLRRRGKRSSGLGRIRHWSLYRQVGLALHWSPSERPKNFVNHGSSWTKARRARQMEA